METTFPKTGTPGIAGAGKTLGGSASTATAEAAGRAHSVVDSAVDGAHGTVDRLASKAASALDRARYATDDLKTTASTKLDDFMNSEDKAEAARTEIREHPLAAVAIALVAGLIIGRL